jgi:hypothetical protein
MIRGSKIACKTAVPKYGDRNIILLFDTKKPGFNAYSLSFVVSVNTHCTPLFEYDTKQFKSALKNYLYAHSFYSIDQPFSNFFPWRNP